MITKEDLNFLINLGKELKTQDNLATRRPLLFQIMDVEIIETSEDNADFKRLRINRPYSTLPSMMFGENEVVQAKDFIRNEYISLLSDRKVRRFLKDTCKNLNDIDNFCEEYQIEHKMYYYEKIKVFKEAFLTFKATKKHLEKFHYRYHKDAKIYCGNAGENEEIARLIEIIEKIYNKTAESPPF